MGKPSRDKGRRRELQIIKAHQAIGVKAERVPDSGASKYRGVGADVDVYAFGAQAAPLVAEVKARASGEGFATLERWLSDADLLVLIRDRADPMVVLPWRVWERLLQRTCGAWTVPAPALADPPFAMPPEDTP